MWSCFLYLVYIFGALLPDRFLVDHCLTSVLPAMCGVSGRARCRYPLTQLFIKVDSSLELQICEKLKVIIRFVAMNPIMMTRWGLAKDNKTRMAGRQCLLDSHKMFNIYARLYINVATTEYHSHSIWICCIIQRNIFIHCINEDNVVLLHQQTNPKSTSCETQSCIQIVIRPESIPNSITTCIIYGIHNCITFSKTTFFSVKVKQVFSNRN